MNGSTTRAMPRVSNQNLNLNTAPAMLINNEPVEIRTFEWLRIAPRAYFSNRSNLFFANSSLLAVLALFCFLPVDGVIPCDARVDVIEEGGHVKLGSLLKIINASGRIKGLEHFGHNVCGW